MIDEAVSAGARQFKACEVLGLSVRTIQNWRKCPGQGDLRRGPKRPPAHKITVEERAMALAELNKPEHAALCPSQLVAKLADEGRYIISESSMYRIMREEKLLKHRRLSDIPHITQPHIGI
jgi:putative transposase